MKHLASQVACRYFLATRPIPIDYSEIRRAKKDIMNFVKREFRKVRPTQSIMGYKMRAEGIVREVVTTLHIEDMAGRTREVDVLVGWSDHQLGAVNNKDTIALFINSKDIFKNALKSFEDRLDSSLSHEVTHLTEYYPITKKQDTSSPEAYYNDPMEVRAYMRNIAEEVLPVVQKEVSRGKRWQDAFRKGLDDSQTWNKIESYLTTQNRRTILRGVSREVQDSLFDD